LALMYVGAVAGTGPGFASSAVFSIDVDTRAPAHVANGTCGPGWRKPSPLQH
jgi:hypothetical protein